MDVADKIREMLPHLWSGGRDLSVRLVPDRDAVRIYGPGPGDAVCWVELDQDRLHHSSPETFAGLVRDALMDLVTLMNGQGS